jgi:EmrB/QacA subfamily drug resistance transporter
MTGNPASPTIQPRPQVRDQAPREPDAAGLTHPDAWRMVVPLLIGAFMALLDVTIVNVALPSIETGIGASETTLAWVVSGYTLAFGLTLIPAGRLGDLYGHRRLFIIGLLLFTLTSLVAGLVQNPAELVAIRALQGFSAGLFNPAIVAFFQVLFQGPVRGKVFGLFGAVIGISSAIGPLLGGFIIQIAGQSDGWRWIFLINVPIGVVALALAWRLLPGREIQGEVEQRRSLVNMLDPVGLFLLVVGLLALLVPLVEGQGQNWPLWTWLSLAGSVVLIVVLLLWERRVEGRGYVPIVAVSLLRRPSFAAGTGLSLVYFGAFTSIFFTLSILLQTGLGYSALETGLIVTPFALGSLVAAANSDRFATRMGRNVLSLGTLMVAVGLGLTLLVLWNRAPDPEPWLLTLPLLLAGAGNGLFIAPNTSFILATVDPRQAGAASGLVNTAQRIGTAIGVAIVSSVLFGTLKVGRDGPAPAFLHSAELALAVSFGLAVIAFLFVFALPHQVRRQGR